MLLCGIDSCVGGVFALGFCSVSQEEPLAGKSDGRQDIEKSYTQQPAHVTHSVISVLGITFITENGHAPRLRAAFVLYMCRV